MSKMLIFFIKTVAYILIISSIGACSSTNTRFESPKITAFPAFSDFVFLYIENKFIDNNGHLAKIEYQNLTPLLLTRAPIIFNKKTLNAEIYKTYRGSFSINDQESKIIPAISDLSHKGKFIIVFRNTDAISVTLRNRYGVPLGAPDVKLNFSVDVYNPTTMKKVWFGVFDGKLSTAVIAGGVVNQDFVDRILENIVDSMIQKQVITPGNT